MILLVSNSQDKSTQLIRSGLQSRGADFLQLGDLDILNGFEADIEFSQFSVKGQVVPLDEISAVWWRRPFGFWESGMYKAFYNLLEEDIAEQTSRELYTILDALLRHLSQSKKILFIGNPFLKGTNKLLELSCAESVGMLIPKTKIISSKGQLVDFINTFGGVVVKSLYNARYIYLGGSRYSMYTTRVTEKSIEVLPDHFAPSLIQEEIKKYFDLRVLYIKGDFFPMAIMSQSRTDTEVDYRVNEKALDHYPVPIDADLKHQINDFMDRMDMNIGLLDFAVDHEGKCYFLEVNHAGQFDAIERFCKYGVYDFIVEKMVSFKTGKSVR